jgi:hypothetical protein
LLAKVLRRGHTLEDGELDPVTCRPHTDPAPDQVPARDSLLVVD